MASVRQRQSAVAPSPHLGAVMEEADGDEVMMSTSPMAQQAPAQAPASPASFLDDATHMWIVSPDPLRNVRSNQSRRAPLTGIHRDDDPSGKHSKHGVPAGMSRLGRTGAEASSTMLSSSSSLRKRFGALPPWQRRWIFTTILTVCSAIVHFYRLHEPRQVAFDEVHFGGFASHYLRRTFFFDVHPPVGKLMLALAGYLAGYDGSFTFKTIGMDYVKGAANPVPYVAMRAVPALCGTLLVPITFLTMLEFGFSIHGALLAAGLCLFENAFVTQCRFMLLDAMLLLFISLAVFCQAKFRNLRHRPFTNVWWMWLVLTGSSLSLAVSVKWVGLFVIALVGLHTIVDLWRLVGDLRLDMAALLQHFLARVICLIVLPFVGYFLFFYIHFAILNTQGPGTPFMGAEFSQGLRQVVNVANAPSLVTHGAQLSFQHLETGGLLHSHPHMYPHGSQQQQVTVYLHKDANNWFFVRHADPTVLAQREHFRHGDRVALEHVGSELFLYSHAYPAPMTKDERHSEVSAAAGPGHQWTVEIMPESDSERLLRESAEKQYASSNPRFVELTRDAQSLVAGRSRFRLVRDSPDAPNVCALFSHKTMLPQWGWHQYEVTCQQSANTTTPPAGSVWRVDQYQQTKQESVETRPAAKDRSGLLDRLRDTWQVNVAAWEANKRLTASHVFASRPEAWPVLLRGISFWQQHATHSQVYLLGNPFIFWGCFPAVLLYLTLAVIYLIRRRRNYRDMDAEAWRKFVLIADLLLLGYVLHYAFFFLMDRQLFLHHYLPAHLFAIMITGAVFDHFIARFRTRTKTIVLTLLLLTVAWSFFHFAFLVYGFPLHPNLTRPRKWLARWDFV